MRLFTCSACGHRMRLAGTRCGKCAEPKPLVKSLALYKVAGFVLVIGGCAALILQAFLLRS